MVASTFKFCLFKVFLHGQRKDDIRFDLKYEYSDLLDRIKVEVSYKSNKTHTSDKYITFLFKKRLDILPNPEIITCYRYKVMKENTIVIATFLAGTILAGLISTTTLTYADSETNQEITNKQKGEASGDATNNFCANNLIESGNGELPLNVGSCQSEPIE
jgi:hypothetical protein